MHTKTITADVTKITYFKDIKDLQQTNPDTHWLSPSTAALISAAIEGNSQCDPNIPWSLMYMHSCLCQYKLSKV